jgi:hypothetical protein
MYLYEHSFDFSIYEPIIIATLGATVAAFLGRNWFFFTKILLLFTFYLVGYLYYSNK